MLIFYYSLIYHCYTVIILRRTKQLTIAVLSFIGDLVFTLQIKYNRLGPGCLILSKLYPKKTEVLKWLQRLKTLKQIKRSYT